MTPLIASKTDPHTDPYTGACGVPGFPLGCPLVVPWSVPWGVPPGCPLGSPKVGADKLGEAVTTLLCRTSRGLEWPPFSRLVHFSEAVFS